MFIDLQHPHDDPKPLSHVLRSGAFTPGEIEALRTAEPNRIIQLMRLPSDRLLLRVEEDSVGLDAYLWRAIQAIDEDAPASRYSPDGSTALDLVVSAHYAVVTAWMYPA